MATYIALSRFTDQGIRGVKDTIERADAVRDAAKKFGAELKQLYWTLATTTSSRLSKHTTTNRPRLSHSRSERLETFERKRCAPSRETK